MKNIFRILMAVAVLFTASCAKEDISSSIAGGGEVEVTFTASLPELGTRAFGEGKLAKELTVNVYEHDTNEALTALDRTVTSNTGVFTFQLVLLKGMKYDIVLWAQDPTCDYYELNGKVVTMDYTGVDANDETRDAFYYYVQEFDPAVNTPSFSLTRPFAQLNAAVSQSDMTAVSNSQVELTTSTVKVKTYTTLDISTGVVGGEAEVEFVPTAMPKETFNTDYTLLSMNYILVPQDAVNAKMVSDVEFTFKANKNGSESAFSGTKYFSVPLKRNYRTNILGSLLTKPTDFTVTIDAEFDGKVDITENVTTAEELLNAVKAGHAQITLMNDITLAEPLNITKDLIIDGNGKTLAVSEQYAIVACPNVEGAAARIDVVMKNININAERTGNDGFVIAAGNANLTLGEGVVINAKGYNCVVEATAATETATNPSLVTIDGAQLSLENPDKTKVGTVIGAGFGSTMIVKSGVLNGSKCNYAVSAFPTGGTINIYDGEITGKLIEYDAYNATEKPTVINIYNGTVNSASALSALANGANVTLSANIEAEESIVIAAGVEATINLNGKTLTGTNAQADGPVIKNEGNLTIVGGTISSTAENGPSAIYNYGTLVVEDATIVGAQNGTSGNASYALNTTGNGSSVELNNVSISGRGAVGATNGTKVTINSGTYHTPYAHWGHAVYASGADTEVTINGGTFTEGYEYANDLWGMYQIYAGEGSKVIVNNGDFSQKWDCANGYDLATSGTGAIEIKGGVFADNPSSQNGKDYVAAGYAAVANSNGTWTVENYQAELQEALNNGSDVTLAADLKVSEALVIPAGEEVTVNLGDKEITSATTDAFVVNEGATLTISGNGTVKSNGAPIRAIGGKVIVEGGTFTQTGAWNTATSTYRYSVDSREGGEVIIKGGTFNTNNGLISVSSDSSVVIDGGEFTFENNRGGTRHFAYVSGDLTINDGVFRGVADSGAGGCFFCGAASTCNIQVNGGKFTSLWTSDSVNRIFESYASGSSINVTGGLFNTNGGIASFVEANTDTATMADYPYKAK